MVVVVLVVGKVGGDRPAPEREGALVMMETSAEKEPGRFQARRLSGEKMKS